MAPYLRYIKSDRSDLITSLEAKNKAHIESIDTKIKEAEEREGDSEISELLRSKAMYYCRIGDRVSRDCNQADLGHGVGRWSIVLSASSIVRRAVQLAAIEEGGSGRDLRDGW